MSTSSKSSPYKNANAFFKASDPFGLTFDDVSLATHFSEILPKETHLETTLSNTLTLPIPIISADMDTVTESRLATAMALSGGLGLIHYNMPEKDQIRHVRRVKNHIHGLIQSPITIQPNLLIGDVLQLIQSKSYNFRTFPVTDKNGKLLGLLTSRAVRERYANRTVKDAMTPRKELPTINKKNLGKDPIKFADKFFTENMNVHKLLVVDNNDHLYGLFTITDIERIMEDARATVKPARDDSFRLLCGAAISATRTQDGKLDKTRILDHVGQLVDEGLDAVAVSVAHGHSSGIGETVKLIRKKFKHLTIIGGNVTSPEGVEFLANAGADAIKIGQGPGSICTTRIVAGVGIPQLTALYYAAKAKTKRPVRIIADGGITKSGDIVKALTLADAVICGGLLAGCREAPGKIIEINGKYYKEYRGMGSLEAMRAGSAARYGHEKKDTNRKAAPEGIEALKEVSDSVDSVISQLIGGLQSGMGYMGAKTLKDLKSKARYIRVTPAGQRESAPHDVVELKTSKASD